MLSLRRIARTARLAGFLAAVGLATAPASAEVAAARADQPGSLRIACYIAQAIIDDPEPVGVAWARHTPVGNTSRVVLNEQGYANGDGRPSLLASATLAPIVVWARNSPAGYDIVYSRFDGTAWTTPEVIVATPADELDPVLLEDPTDGSIHLLYWIQDLSPRVLHRQAPADLSSWTAPVQVSQPGEIAARPAGVFHNGLLRVSYEVHDHGFGAAPRRIELATRVGGSFSQQTVAVTQHAGHNWPEVHSAGNRMWVDWIDADGEMGWIRQPAPGLWEPVGLVPFANNEERDYHVRGRVAGLARN
jgi:hypothetical protein